MTELLLQNYRPTGGIHPDSATVANGLAYLGVLAPHTGKPFTEEFCLGLGGGLGFRYKLLTGKRFRFPLPGVAQRRAAADPRAFAGALLTRIGLPFRFLDTGGAKTAEGQLIDVLAAGKPGIVWVDVHRLPYHFLPADAPPAPFPWALTIYGIDENSVLVDDLSKKPFLLTRADLRRARARPASMRHLLLQIGSGRPGDPERHLLGAIADTVEEMRSRRAGCGLRGLEALGRAFADRRSRRGFAQLYPEGRGLFGALLFLHESVGHLGTDGVGLRAMYADFLGEAGRLLGRKDLARLSRRYRAISKLWSRFAELLLPQEQFGEVSTLVEKKHVVLRTQGPSGLSELRHFCQRLSDMRGRFDAECPLTARERTALLEQIAAAVEEIHRAETEAVADLEEAVASPKTG